MTNLKTTELQRASGSSLDKIEQHCILLGCSKAKKQGPRLLPAIDRYDGPLFRTLRKFLHTHPNVRDSLTVLIVSAEFGLINAATLIPIYDSRISRNRAIELQTRTLNDIEQYLTVINYKELFVALSKDYCHVVTGLSFFVPANTKLVQARGPLGIKARYLVDWLHKTNRIAPTRDSDRLSASQPIRGHVKFRGSVISLTPSEVMTLASEALLKGASNWDNFREWYVVVGEMKVGPKWLVSQLTGIPVNLFTAGEARNVLYQLSIPVYRA